MENTDYYSDLKFLYNKLLSHPMFVESKSKLLSFENLYDSVICSSIYSFDDFINAANLLTCFFSDGHTNIELPYTKQDKCINIPCHWDENRLFISCDYKDIKSNSEIIAIEHKPTQEIVTLMSSKIPHENIYLVKSRMVNYPYKNYHFFSELNLKALFGDKNEFEITFLSNCKRFTLPLTLSEYDGFLNFKDTNHFISYEIKGETAFLYLTACIFNEKYTFALKELADMCEERNIKALVLDLSENMGGSSAVIEEFIKYVNIKEFKRYEMIDYTAQLPNHLTSREQLIKNSKSKKGFPKDIYCRVSYNTFSSARTFAVTLKDNGIAKIIGMPTGGKPSSYGMPKRYKMPNSNIDFRVSRCLFLRPDKEHDNDIALVPDTFPGIMQS